MLMIVLGAGASFDSVDANVVTIEHPGWRPPLANDLFASRMSFRRLADQIPHAHQAIHRLQRAAANGDDVEVEMDVLQQEATDGIDVRYSELLALRYYVHSVIAACESNYANHSYTNMRLLIDALRVWQNSHDEPVLVVTFNYDTIVERAVSDVYGWGFNQFNDYVQHDELRLFKLHGSITWHRRSGRMPFANENPQIDALIEQARELQLSDEIYPEPGGFGLEEVQAGTGGLTGRARIPALALPFSSKLEFEAPPGHSEQLEAKIPEVDKVLVIGWKGGEDTFLEMLEPLQQATSCLVVGSEPQHVADTAQRLRGAGLKWLFGRSGGFSTFVRAGGMKAFLEDDETLGGEMGFNVHDNRLVEDPLNVSD